MIPKPRSVGLGTEFIKLKGELQIFENFIQKFKDKSLTMIIIFFSDDEKYSIKQEGGLG